jgi:hypothetical protein
MAIVDDIKRDRRTKNVLAQTNTKTVSAPNPDTGLTGDSLPAEVFTVSDFELIKNQVHLEENNFQLMEALNVMGQITNMQSQSGPIPGTGKIETFSSSYSSGVYVTVFTPKAGEVWEVVAADFNATLSSGTVDSVQLYLSDGSTSVMFAENTGDNFDSFKDYFASPILVDENLTIQARASDANITALAVRVVLIRVR